ncbi:MAG: methanogenesis marker 16 metalloprotein [Methanothrix sp.]|nr:methanogenesis marker 16 metalloprotein [Methanothrix sp.]
MVGSYSEILGKVERGEAVVITAQEVAKLVESGESNRLSEVDVVTTATRAVMSGTYAVLSFPVAGPASFLRAKRVWINDIAAEVGPCPNENLGVLDLLVLGTAHSQSRPNYGGGHLFRDLVERKIVHVDVETNEGRTLSAEVGLDEMPYARLFGSRHAFKNYSAFVNAGKEPVNTIFHSRGFAPHCKEATFSGCGRINPLKNDPLLESIGIGTRILMNGAEGYVLGTGTRSSKERPNLSGFADMHKMVPELMGGFATSAGPECICSWAVPIPVISKTILAEMARPDRDIAMPVNDVNSRTVIGQADYGDVWTDVDLEVEFEPQKCTSCHPCPVVEACPMKAVKSETGSVCREEALCFHCGLCVTKCPSGAFRCRLGAIRLQTKAGMVKTIPVVLRQSDRLRAIRQAEELKRRIRDGSFKISQPVERIS